MKKRGIEVQDNAGKFYYVNGNIVPEENSDVYESIENRKDIKARIYEVIRVINGVPLFIEQHVERLNCSIAAFDDSLSFSVEEIRIICRELCTHSEVKNCNLQFTYFICEDCAVEEVHYIKKHFYPDESMYVKGVKTDTICLGRSNPSVKNYVPEYKQKVNEAMKDNFELLLVNENNEILEGSRSNFFYVIGEDVYTCPTALVLNGITRINVISAIEKAGLKLHEEALRLENIHSIDGAFISGTSINVLPVANIGNVDLKKNGSLSETIVKIGKQFDEIVYSYVKRCEGEY